MARFKTKRQKVYKHDRLYQSHLDGLQFSKLVELFIALQKEHDNNAIFEIERDDDPYSPSVTCIVSSWHVETDEEYQRRKLLHDTTEQARKEEAKKYKEEKEQRDRRQYLRLKKKYGK